MRGDFIGSVFGRLKVTEYFKDGDRKDYWKCICECGNAPIVFGVRLQNGETRSCGCLRRDTQTKHGMHKTRFYGIWRNMTERCRNSNSVHYSYYGGRGIKVCDSWSDFNNFRDDLYDSYLAHEKEFGEVNTTLDRINTDGDYDPNNTRWATRSEQQLNTRTSKNNTSGHKGVSWMSQKNKWRARLGFQGKEYHLGVYTDIDDAVLAREEKLKQLRGV